MPTQASPSLSARASGASVLRGALPVNGIYRLCFVSIPCLMMPFGPHRFEVQQEVTPTPEAASRPATWQSSGRLLWRYNTGD